MIVFIIYTKTGNVNIKSTENYKNFAIFCVRYTKIVTITAPKSQKIHKEDNLHYPFCGLIFYFLLVEYLKTAAIYSLLK